MQKRHQDNKLYFEEQSISTKRYVIPYIQQVKQIDSNSSVLEIGCGQGGNLLPFLEKGCTCVGLDISQDRVSMGQDFFKTHPCNNKIELFYDDIYKIDSKNFKEFDVILLRDVIEHLTDHDQLMKLMKPLLKDDGVIFFAFPPWRMPFGGHQQALKNRVLSKLPFYHTLPKPVFRWSLKLGKTDEEVVRGMLRNKQTGLSIAKFRKLVKQNGYEFVKTTDWLINPHYEVKFHLKPQRLYLLNKIPYFRDFFTTSYYAIIKQKN